MKTINTLIQKTTLIFLSCVISVFSYAQPNCRWAKGCGGAQIEGGNGIAVDVFGNVYSIGNFNSATITFTGAPALTNVDNTGGSSDIFIVKSDSCGNIIWAKRLGDEALDDRGTAITVDKTGNVYVTGSSYAYNITLGSFPLQNSGTGFCVYTAKYDPTGNVIWAKVMNPTGTVIASSINVDKNNNVYVSGYYASDSVNIDGTYLTGTDSDYHSFLVKYNTSGNLLWAKSAGAANNQSYSVTTDTTGNVYIAGYYQDSIRFDNTVLIGQSYQNAYLAKYNSAGNVVWVKDAGGNYDAAAVGVAVNKFDDIFIIGYYNSDSVSFGANKLFLSPVNSYANGFLVKYNSAGTAQWAKRIEGGEIYTQSIALNQSGDIFVGGNFYSSSISLNTTILNNITTSDSTADIFLAKYDMNGNVKWAKTAGGLRNDYIEQVTTGANGIPNIIGEYRSGTITFGQSTLANAGEYDVFITNDITRNGVVTPQLCEVTVDDNSQNNIVYWDKTPYTNVMRYLIYREISTNVYKPIGSIYADSLSEFIDTVRTKYFPNTGNPNVGTYRYKIQIQDTLGNYSLLSPYHNTIYIVDNGSGQFTWNPAYTIEGAPNPVNNYVLMCDTINSGVWSVVGSVTGSQNTIADPKYTSFPNGKWRVETDWNILCTPTRAGINTTRSNIKSSAVSSSVIDKEVAHRLLIYPNPATQNIIIQSPSTGRLQIFDALGQLLYDEEFSTKQNADGMFVKQMDISRFKKGIYICGIQTEKTILYNRLVVK